MTTDESTQPEADGSARAGFDATCFFITPIGDEDSAERRRSDEILNHVLGPAAQALGLNVIRADRIESSGRITEEVIDYVLGSSHVVADVTGANPNVYYELAYRIAHNLPVTLIAQTGTALPFDIYDRRTVFFDVSSLTEAHKAREALTKRLGEQGAGTPPTHMAVDRLSALLARFEELGGAFERIDELVAAFDVAAPPYEAVGPLTEGVAPLLSSSAMLVDLLAESWTTDGDSYRVTPELADAFAAVVSDRDIATHALARVRNGYVTEEDRAQGLARREATRAILRRHVYSDGPVSLEDRHPAAPESGADPSA